ncbi:MAG: hypothetical protein AB7K09_09075 [Planctomycetota bacterium]
MMIDDARESDASASTSSASAIPAPAEVGTPTPDAGRRAPLDVADLRRFRRSDHSQPVRVVVHDESGQVVDQGWAEVADLSPSGVRLRGLRLHRRTELTDTHRLALDIVFDDGSMFVEVRSAPRWADESGCLGLEFDAVDVRVV